MFDLISN